MKFCRPHTSFLVTCALTLALGVAAMSGFASSRVNFWLGPSFSGFPLTHEAGGTFIYGDCDASEGSCAPPLAVQNWTSCDRNPVKLDVTPRRLFRVRGGGIAADYGEASIDLGTGRTTVAVFADSDRLAADAVRALRPRSQEEESSTPLPPPVYPPAVKREIKRVVVARRRLRSPRAIGKATGLAPAVVRLRLTLARMLGEAALRGVPPPRRSWRAVQRDRQASFNVQEFGLRRTAADLGISVRRLRRVVRRVRGLAGTCGDPRVY